MTPLQRKYVKSMIFGLCLLIAGLAGWRLFGLVPLPALPNVRVPTMPFLTLAGLILTAVSIALYREEANKD